MPPLEHSPYESIRTPTQAVGGFIRDCGPWDWWLTLTFAGQVTSGRALDILRCWTKALARGLHHHVNLAWVLDGKGGRWHIHALLGLPDGVTVSVAELDSGWRATAPGLAGFTDIRAYDAARAGAAFYLGQKTEYFDWTISVACPRRPQCRRKKGCVASKFAW